MDRIPEAMRDNKNRLLIIQIEQYTRFATEDIADLADRYDRYDTRTKCLPLKRVPLRLYMSICVLNQCIAMLYSVVVCVYMCPKSIYNNTLLYLSKSL